MRLHELLKARRDEVIDCWSTRVAGAAQPGTLTHAELLDHIPLFVDEIIAALYPDALPLPPPAENAAEHGAQRLRLGFDVGEVVREYGLLHECILQLAERAQIDVSLH